MSIRLTSRLLIGACVLTGICGAQSGLRRVAAAPEERILFSSNRADPTKVNLYSISPTGGTPKQLTKSEAKELDPALSPDGKRVACAVLENPALPVTDIYVMDLDGKNRKRLTNGDVLAFDPQWSPDGKQVAYSWLVGGQAPKPAITVVDADGKNPRKVGDGMFPYWSPDGKRMLFSNMDANAQGMPEPHLYTMDADGTNVKKLAEGVGVMGVWSPDGKQIVFMGDGGNNQPDLFVMDADGKNRRQLTKTDDVELGPEWSADGKRVYFTRSSKTPQNPPAARIYVIDADGKNEKPLTGGESLDITGGAFLFLGRSVTQPGK